MLGPRKIEKTWQMNGARRADITSEVYVPGGKDLSIHGLLSGKGRESSRIPRKNRAVNITFCKKPPKHTVYPYRENSKIHSDPHKHLFTTIVLPACLIGLSNTVYAEKQRARQVANQEKAALELMKKNIRELRQEVDRLKQTLASERKKTAQVKK